MPSSLVLRNGKVNAWHLQDNLMTGCFALGFDSFDIALSPNWIIVEMVLLNCCVGEMTKYEIVE